MFKGNYHLNAFYNSGRMKDKAAAAFDFLFPFFFKMKIALVLEVLLVC